ncbi:hypothetical protein C0584_02985 [Candidatus Parcubacteria bacterium]|nr:MAG: hypothetical protein C0584_02985 [Candidatus Parcubacteria bacterium]
MKEQIPPMKEDKNLAEEQSNLLIDKVLNENEALKEYYVTNNKSEHENSHLSQARNRAKTLFEAEENAEDIYENVYMLLLERMQIDSTFSGDSLKLNLLKLKEIVNFASNLSRDIEQIKSKNDLQETTETIESIEKKLLEIAENDFRGKEIERTKKKLISQIIFLNPNYSNPDIVKPKDVA